MTSTLLLADSLIDGTGVSPQVPGATLIEGSRISAVGKTATEAAPMSVRRVELPGCTLLPGFIDAHLHLDGWRSLNRTDWVLMPDGLRALHASMDAARMLAAGFTSVRDMGSVAAVSLKEAINAGGLPGPRMQVAVKGIYQTAGQGDRSWLPTDLVIERESCRLANGPDDCRQAVREMVRAGADIIKIASSGGPNSMVPHFSQIELEALTDESHRMGYRVACHAIGRTAIKNAVLAGVDSIEHGYGLDEATADLMAKKGVFIVCDLLVRQRYATRGLEFGYSRRDAEAALRAVEEGMKSLQVCLRAGVKIAFGTDYGGQPILAPDELADGLGLMVDAGVPTLEVIRAATGRAAEVLGWGDQIGAIHPGLFADIVAVYGDPIKDIRALRNVALVIQDGRAIPQDIAIWPREVTLVDSQHNRQTDNDLSSVAARPFSVFETTPEK